MNMIKEIAKEYLHVSNSGVTFSVIDEGHGPSIVIESNAFGNLVQSFKVMTDVKALKALSKMFTKAAEYKEFSEDYCHKAM